MRVLFCILIGIAVILLVVWLIQLLWNWLVPELFKGPKIRFKHALGIFILARLLLGFGFAGRFPAYYWHHHPGNVQHHWFWPKEHPGAQDNSPANPQK